MRRIFRSRRTLLFAGVIGALLAAFVTFVALNLVQAEKHVEQKIVHRHGVANPQFQRELGILLGPPIRGGNIVRNLENGAEIFPAMLKALRQAERSITFETYIYWSGEIGRKFAETLADRVRKGVKVHVLIDWVGGDRMDEDLLELMREAGVELHFFHPLHWYHLSRMNNRTHRKLVVVDGRVGFTGGVGIADPWDGHGDDPEHWRDSHYRIEGPAVAQMQAAFADNWLKTTGKVLSGRDYFPPLAPVGEVRAQVFTSSPTSGSDSMQLMYLMAIASAEHSIDLAAPYFVPDPLSREALLDALKRGVQLRILTSGEHTDYRVVRRASRARWGELLEAGARIYEFKPAMYHAKMLVVDRNMVSVGSTNFDNRSFRLNSEANLNIYDPAFSARVTAVFEQDLVKSREITLADWQQRPWGGRLVEWLAALLSPQL